MHWITNKPRHRCSPGSEVKKIYFSENKFVKEEVREEKRTIT
jgi:hypothetical protein